MQTATNSLEMKSKNGNYQRRILIPGIDNLRDLGGYPTADGRYVRWGCFYRSAAITPRDAEARALFDKLHIKTILDYRAKTEIGAAVDYLPEGAKYYLLPAIPANEAGEVDQQGNLDMVTMIRNIRTPQQADEMYCYFRQIYAELPFHNPSYHKMFAAMDGLDSVPFIQHCSAGKDRTGVGCALLLLSLGVEEQTVMEDYMLSAVCRKDANDKFVAQFVNMGIPNAAIETVKLMLTVHEDLLTKAMDAIHAKYATFEEYLLEEYAVDPNRICQWKSLYLCGEEER